MLGILFQGVASFFEEISGSLGKAIVTKQASALFALTFINSVGTIAMNAAYALAGEGRFVLHPASYPTLALLCVMAATQAYAAMMGTALSSRSTFNFVRTGTMPLLLGIDLALGVAVTARQSYGILLIVVALGVLFMNHGIDRKGLGWVVISTVNSAASIAIYKWHITTYNSVAAEQIVLHAAIALSFLAMALRHGGLRPFAVLRNGSTWAQTFTYGFGVFLEGFAYQYGPASVILAAKRSFAVLWAIVTGNRVFNEGKLGLKLAASGVVICGIVLLAL